MRTSIETAIKKSQRRIGITRRGNTRTGIWIGYLVATGMAAGVFLTGQQPAKAAGGDEQLACRQMIEAWYSGNADKLNRNLHAGFPKQGVIDRPQPAMTATLLMNKEEFIAAVASQKGKLPEIQWDINVETMDLSEFLATVKVIFVHLIDVCQLGKIDGEWRAFNVIWTVRKKPA